MNEFVRPESDVCHGHSLLNEAVKNCRKQVTNALTQARHGAFLRCEPPAVGGLPASEPGPLPTLNRARSTATIVEGKPLPRLCSSAATMAKPTSFGASGAWDLPVPLESFFAMFESFRCLIFATGTRQPRLIAKTRSERHEISAIGSGHHPTSSSSA